MVYQKLEDVPEGFSVPEGRVKPWGTGHAALCAARVLGDAPYAVINADDFYGREGFRKIYQFLKESKEGPVLDLAMVGFYLRNTVTENGYVSRGVCQVKDHMLEGITERTRIEQRQDGIAYSEDGGETWVPLPGDTVGFHEPVGLPRRVHRRLGGGLPAVLPGGRAQEPRRRPSSTCPSPSTGCWTRAGPG